MNKFLNYSFLEKSNSSGWKGILILLIVLGHNSILCKPSVLYVKKLSPLGWLN